MQFSTKDSDNDVHEINCAEKERGGWWYANCGESNLNGIYYPYVLSLKLSTKIFLIMGYPFEDNRKDVFKHVTNVVLKISLLLQGLRSENVQQKKNLTLC